MTNSPNLTGLQITVRYFLFAIVAMAVNIGSQEFIRMVLPGELSYVVGILIGTATGLVVKYVLDRKYIFRFRPKNISAEGRAMFLYSLYGVLTTLWFWFVESVFHFTFDSRTMTYVGAILGLSTGYVVKYFLDSRSTFASSPPAPNV